MQKQILELLAQKEILTKQIRIELISDIGGFPHTRFCKEGLKVGIHLLSFSEVEKLKKFLTQFDSPKLQTQRLLTQSELEVRILPENTPSSLIHPKPTEWEKRKVLEQKIRAVWSEIIQSGDNSILNGRSLKEFMETYSNILSKKRTLSLYKLKQKELKPILKAIKKVKLS